MIKKIVGMLKKIGQLNALFITNFTQIYTQPDAIAHSHLSSSTVHSFILPRQHFYQNSTNVVYFILTTNGLLIIDKTMNNILTTRSGKIFM